MTISGVQISITPVSAWADLFDNAPMVRERIMELLANINVDLDTECETIENPSTWEELLAALECAGHNVEQESLSGLYYTVGDANTPAVYAMPKYEWDGGAPINTRTFNLDMVAASNIGGSTASLVQRKDATRPGLIMHRECEFGRVVFQVC